MGHTRLRHPADKAGMRISILIREIFSILIQPVSTLGKLSLLKKGKEKGLNVNYHHTGRSRYHSLSVNARSDHSYIRYYPESAHLPVHSIPVLVLRMLFFLTFSTSPFDILINEI